MACSSRFLRLWLWPALWLTLWLSVHGCAIPIIGAPALMPRATPVAATPVAESSAAPAQPGPAAAPASPVLATAAIAAPAAPLPTLSLTRPAQGESCMARLTRAGVLFEALDPKSTKGVEQPIRVTGTLGGVSFVARDNESLHGVLDCRLALVLLQWSTALRQAGVSTVEHYSIYRPGARTPRKGQVSGHARGLAIDAARFHMQDGSVYEVLDDWEGRDHGEQPCPLRAQEGPGAKVMRGTVCAAVADSLFQVVLTPHHDKAHHNHIHLELKPEVAWTYVR